MRRAGIIVALGTLAGVAPELACGDAYDESTPNVGGDAGAVDGAGPNDGGTSDGAATDGAPVQLCDPAKPFGEPALLNPGAETLKASWPRLTPDELEIVFTSDVASGWDIYYAKRLSRDVPFPAPLKLDVLSSGQYDGDPMISADGLTVFFYSNRALSDGGLGQEVYAATRTSRAGSFGTPKLLAFSSLATSEESQPFLARHAPELWFVSDRPGPGEGDIYRAKVKPTDPTDVDIDTVELVAELSTARDEWAPILSGDGKTIYFASTRTDGGAKGGRDIWKATRVNVDEGFGIPTNVSELNTPENEVPGSISDDGCRLYLHKTSNGREEMFVATKTP